MSDDTMRDDMYDGASDAERGATPPACAAFDESLADYLEGTLDPAARSKMEAHRAGCARCAALVADLQEISVAARALPPIVPSATTTESMWRGVSERIAAPAISIASARSIRRGRFDGWRRQLAAAAALVLLTAGVTYSVTRVVDRNRDPRFSAAAPGTSGSILVPVAPILVPDSGATQVVRGDSIVRGAPDATDRGLGESAGRERRLASGGNGTVKRPSATATYEREIRGLGRILDERRGELDSATVAVLEKNLAVIDQAIRQSREALARDPRSRFLDQQLNSALDKKVELLRTAALLPSRT
jgi:hypothetical protein